MAVPPLPPHETDTSVMRRLTVGWVQRNAKVVIGAASAVVSGLATAALMYGGFQADARHTREDMQEVKDAIHGMAGQLGEVSKVIAGQSSDIRSLHEDMDAQKRWRERVEDVAEVRVTRKPRK